LHTRLRRYEDLVTAQFVTLVCCCCLSNLNHLRAREIVIGELDKAKHGFRLLGSVLTPDHVHLRVRTGRDKIAQRQRERELTLFQFFKKILDKMKLSL